jgi:SAM-dependent methyltransferase
MTATLSPPLETSAAAAICRFCGAGLTRTFVDLGSSPRCDRYLRAWQLTQTEPVYPLHVWVCDECFLVQLPRDANGNDVVSEYPYFSSASQAWLEHARRYTDRVIEELRLTPANHVVEVASNDGYLLQYFVERGIPVLGIDRAANVARAAIARGVPTRIDCFNGSCARALRADAMQADLVIVNNVLGQVHDVNDFVAGLKLILAPRGVMTLEFPHLMRLIAEHQFDTISHEHFSYFSLLAVTRIFATNGLTIYDVDEFDIHGGSLRLFVCHSEDPLRPITPRVDSLMARERDAGVDTAPYYAEFTAHVEEARHKLRNFLVAAKRGGKRIAGYGTPGKGNAFLAYCGIHTDVIDYAVDRHPVNHGTYLPGTHIPIRSPEWIRETRPDYVLILPGNLENEVVPQLEYIREWGGRCVVTIPEVRVVT